MPVEIVFIAKWSEVILCYKWSFSAPFGLNIKIKVEYIQAKRLFREQKVCSKIGNVAGIEFIRG
jgi:hypothetical protein